MKKGILLFTFIVFANISTVTAQKIPDGTGNLDSLKREIMNLRLDVDNIEMSLTESKNTLKTGVFIATLGYTVTIIGGQLLGTEPELGEALLYAGGAIGIGGTIVLVNGFNKLDLRLKKRKP